MASAHAAPPAHLGISVAEWDLRVQLAAVYRLVDLFGWSELIWTHSTVRLPDEDHHFLINPYGYRFDEVRASNLVKVDRDGNVIGDPSQEINPAGFVIHSAIHMMRPDVRCIVHTHTVAGMAVAALADGILPVNMYAIGDYGRIAYHDYEGPSLDLGERERLAANLDDKNLLVLRNHGLLTCGESVAQAFVRMYRMERSCQVQLAARATGAQLAIPPRAVLEKSVALNDDFMSTQDGKGYGRKANPEFDALLRLLDQRDPSYRT